MKVINRFILGIQFLTRIPITSRPVPCEPEDFRGAMYFFTTIGAIVGGLQYLVFIVTRYFLPGGFAALLAAIAGIVITGGIHLDGLADIFDGFGANAERERTFEIMKDSRVGAFGALAIMLDLLMHFVAFQYVIRRPSLIILVPVFAKLGVVFLCFIGKNAKKGLGALWIENIDFKGLLCNALIAIIIAILINGVLGACILGIWVILATYGLNKKFTNKLGGVTGDC